MWAPLATVQVILVLVLVYLLALATIAVMGRGDWRVFAIGFIIFAVGYFLSAVLIENQSLKLPNSNKTLPTAYLWGQLYDPIVHRVFIKDGESIPASLEPKLDDRGNVTDKDGNVLGNLNAGRAVQLKPTPSLETFHTIGQVLWMLLFGYLGGKFAVGFRIYQVRQGSELLSTE